MNREQAKKLLPVIQAFAEGKDIEVKFGRDRQWDKVNGTDPYFNPELEWRIKPEVKEGYVNIYDNNNKQSGSMWKTRELADKHAVDERIACIKITYTEGEGL